MVGIHRAIEEGQIGQVKMAWYNNFRPPFFKKVGNFILQQRLSGGALTKKNCHHFDLFEWFIGSPATWVMASGGQDWDATEAELRHFLECIREGKEPLVDGEKGLRSVAVALAAEKSIKEGRRVAVSEVM